jgi:heptose-I-phosphate ethanolaminephosphotransferase
MFQNFNFKLVAKAFIISLICFFAYGSFIIGTNIFTDRLAFLIIFCCAALSLNYGVTTNTSNLNKLNLLFFLCCSILPLICKVTASSWSVSNHYGEYLLSFTGLLFIQLLYSILFLEKKNNLFLKVLATILSWCFCTIQLLIGFYYLATKALLNDFAILAVCQTNPSEALSYLKDYIPIWLILLTIITFLGLLIFIWRIFSNYNSLHFTTTKTKVTLLLSAFMLIDLYIFFALCPANFIQRTNYSVQNSLATYKEFRELRQKTLAEKQQNSFEAKYTGSSPGTYVLVIGESETRDHMGAYGYFRPTTPWLSNEVKSNSNLILFSHAYACANATTRVLALGLN